MDNYQQEWMEYKQGNRIYIPHCEAIKSNGKQCYKAIYVEIESYKEFVRFKNCNLYLCPQHNNELETQHKLMTIKGEVLFDENYDGKTIAEVY